MLRSALLATAAAAAGILSLQPAQAWDMKRDLSNVAPVAPGVSAAINMATGSSPAQAVQETLRPIGETVTTAASVGQQAHNTVNTAIGDLAQNVAGPEARRFVEAIRAPQNLQTSLTLQGMAATGEVLQGVNPVDAALGAPLAAALE